MNFKKGDLVAFKNNAYIAILLSDCLDSKPFELFFLKYGKYGKYNKSSFWSGKFYKSYQFDEKFFIKKWKKIN